jgi:hypothetical protein
MHYATLHQVRQYLGLAADETGDDARLTELINGATASIDEYCGRRFDPRRDTLLFDVPVQTQETIGVYGVFLSQRLTVLNLKQDLANAIAITNGDGTTVDLATVLFEPGNSYPKTRIRMKNTGDGWMPNSDGETRQVISVDGIWCFHRRYDDAWVDTLDTVQNDPLASGATSVTVADADGAAGDGASNRFQVGNLIRFGSTDDGEYAFVAGVNPTGNTLTTTRGYNGTTAAQQAKGTKIYVFRPQANVMLAAIRLVVWRYRQKDSDVFDRQAIIGTGVKIVPSQTTPDVIAMLPPPKMVLP